MLEIIFRARAAVDQTQFGVFVEQEAAEVAVVEERLGVGGHHGAELERVLAHCGGAADVGGQEPVHRLRLGAWHWARG